MILQVLDLRFRGLYDLKVAHRAERFHYALEDLIVTDFINPTSPFRVTAVLEALRVAALSTYENRRVSTGALLLGTDFDPAAPGWTSQEGAPRFNARLTAIKGFHRLCDGMRTVFLVDRQGELARAVDIDQWANRALSCAAVADPCPRVFNEHTRATADGGHVCLLLTPSQEMKVFAGGRLTFAFSTTPDGGCSGYPGQIRRVVQGDQRDLLHRPCGSGSLRADALRILSGKKNERELLFVVLRDPARSIPQLIAPADRIVEEVVSDDPQDPENLSPRMAKRTLHHVVRGQNLSELDESVLEAIAGLDGAVVTDHKSRLLTFGAILRIPPEALTVARAVEGARTLAALGASYHGPVLKVSEDGFLTMYLGGRRVWEL